MSSLREECQEYRHWSGDTPMEGGGAGLRKRERTFRAFPKGRLDHQGQLQRWEVAGSKEKQSIKLPRTWRRWGGGGAPDKHRVRKGSLLGQDGR